MTRLDNALIETFRASVRKLHSEGVNLVPVKGKSPSCGEGWQNQKLSEDTLIRYLETGSTGLGILCGEISNGLVVVDYDCWDAYREADLRKKETGEGEDLNTPICASGLANKVKKLYRVPEEYWPQIRGSKVKISFSGGGQLEILWGGSQAVIPPSLHPDTGKPYIWVNGWTLDCPIAIAPQWVINALVRGDSRAWLFPLGKLLSQQNQDRLRQGATQGSRNDGAAALVRDALGCQRWLEGNGIPYSGDAESLLQNFGQKCNPSIDSRELDAVYKSAERSECFPSRTDYLETSVQNYYRNHHGRNFVGDLSVVVGDLSVPHRQTQSNAQQEFQGFVGGVGDFSSESLNETLEELPSLLDIQKESLDIDGCLHPQLAKPLLDTAREMPTSVELLFTTLLPVVASLMGTKFKVVIKESVGYTQPPVFRSAIVVYSGDGKSHAQKAIIKALLKMEDEAHGKFSTEMEEYEKTLSEYESKKKKADKYEEIGEPPEKPAARVRFLVQDNTREKLVQIHCENPRGFLVHRDELAANFKSQNKYRAGDDTEAELSEFDGSAIIIDRVTKELFIDKSAISRTGTIQWDVLCGLMGDHRDSNGQWARWLLCSPKIPKQYKNILDEVPDIGLDTVLTKLYRSILDLQPQDYLLSYEAKVVWQDFQHKLTDIKDNEPQPGLRNAYAKLESYLSRIALVLHVINSCVEGKNPEPVISGETMFSAVGVTSYYLNQLKWIYGHTAPTEELTGVLLNIQDLANRREKPISARDVQRSVNALKKVEAKQIQGYFLELSNLGLGSVEKNKYTAKATDITDKSTQTHTQQGFTPPTKPPTNHRQSPTTTDSFDEEDPPSTNGQGGTPNPQPKPDSPVSPAGAAEDEPTPKDLVSTNTETATCNPREAVTVEGGKVQVDLDRLDLAYKPDKAITPWEPSIKLKPYSQLSKIYLDIETTGLESSSDRVISVGLMDGTGKTTLISNLDETALLEQVAAFLSHNKPQLLIGHNLFEFDLPFLMERCSRLGIWHPFKKADKSTKITSASFHGQPIEFTNVYWTGVDIIDTFHQVGIYDKSKAVLSSYSLKNSVLALELRDDRRLELSHSEINDHWASGNTETIHEYLKLDLEDTQLLADFLIPVIYYQKMIVPNISLQRLAVASPAAKWEKIIESFYRTKPESDEKKNYPGGYVSCNPGLYRNAAKIDVSSLYPSIMLRYGLCSKKDQDQVFLSVLQYLKVERLRLKKLAKVGDIQADQQQNALKILLNGGYGFLGTGYYVFNDYEAAALVTGYGQKLIKQMIATVEANGGAIAEVDTDGIIFSHEYPQTIAEVVKLELPEGIDIDLDWTNKTVYVPKMKSYLIFEADGSVKRVGEFRKRNRSKLQTDYPVEYLRHYLNSPEEAETYHNQLKEQIESGQLSLEWIKLTEKIRKGDKRLTEAGLGKEGDKVTYYLAEKPRCHKTTGRALTSVSVPTTEGQYFTGHYLKVVEEMHTDIVKVITGEKPLAADDQLGLFELLRVVEMEIELSISNLNAPQPG